MDHARFLNQIFSKVDIMDAEKFAAFFDSDGSFKFANQEPAHGVTGIQVLAQGVFDLLKGIKHQVVNTATNSANDLFVEGLVTYLRKDGESIELPFACVFQFADRSGIREFPLVRRYRSYIDIAPLMQNAL